MFLDIFRFELNFHRRQYLIYVLCGVFFLMFFLATASPNVSIGGSTGNVNLNSPDTILNALAAVSVLAMFGAIAFTANAVVRDFELNTVEMFFSRPVPKFDYVYGRFLGTFLFGCLVYLAGLLGVLVGGFMPWLDPERIGAFSITPYLYGTALLGMPNLFVMCSIFFCVATVTRSMMATYVSAMVLFMLTLVLGNFTEKETVELTSILDPFGTTALAEVTRYWTVFEKNSNLPDIDGAILANRLFWLGIGVAFLVAAYPLFPFSLDKGQKKSRKLKKKNHEQDEPAENKKTVVVTVHQNFDLHAQWQQFLSQTRLEIRTIVRSAPFLVLLLFGLLQVVFASLGDLGNITGTSLYPTTHSLIRVINGTFSISLLLVLVYYSAELMVRERTVKVLEIMDAMPFPNWVMIAAKLTGLITVIASMLFIAMVAAIGVQLWKEFYEIDVLLYLKGLLFFFQIPFYLLTVVSVFFYVLTRSKYITMFIVVAYVIFNQTLAALGFEHQLYRIGQLAPLYSAFSGYSQNLVPYLWQTLYAALFGGLLLVVIHLLWPRGAEDDWPSRVQVLRQRMTRPVVASLWTLSIGWLAVGGFIYYNTVVLNPYVTRSTAEKLQADYENTYKQYEFKTMPVIEKVSADVDLFPARQELSLQGSYQMANLSEQALEELHFSLQSETTLNKLEVPGASLTHDDAELGYRIYTFDKPLQPGERIMVSFDVDWLTPGFTNSGHSRKLVVNGTFVNNTDFFPMPGYQSGRELQDNNSRREQDLGPIQRMSKIDDPSAWMRAGFAGNRVEFETTVSTRSDQIAIAPGYLQKEWTKGQRRYFHYKMDVPIWNFYSFMSADYEVKRDQWNDVAIEVYYHHDYNIDTMIRATKNSLDYFATNFSPYQYRQFRILEFPRFQGRFAQSFPNTIPFSESIGFTADLRDPKEIDYVYYVTAHELAHQWWAHQVLGADVQGQTMIVETLAQYSALMAMEEEYGKEQMKRFLAFELDRYLQGRGGELIDEMPLYLVENQQYIHYNKGSVVLYALQDYVGKDVINAALAEFIEQFAFKGPPYPTTRDLITIIRRSAGSEYAGLITDMFEKIVLYDLKVKESTVNALDSGSYEVTLTVTARKFEADGAGREVEVPIASWIDIGIMGEKQGDAEVPEVIHLEKYELSQSEQIFTIIVDKKPVSVGIDPMHKLIDRNPDDNVSGV